MAPAEFAAPAGVLGNAIAAADVRVVVVNN